MIDKSDYRFAVVRAWLQTELDSTITIMNKNVSECFSFKKIKVNVWIEKLIQSHHSFLSSRSGSEVKTNRFETYFWPTKKKYKLDILSVQHSIIIKANWNYVQKRKEI